jgi:hypothetical protein
MALDIAVLDRLLQDALGSALAGLWSEAQGYARMESIKLAHTLAHVEELSASGRISPLEASALVEMQKNAMQAVLLAVTGLNLLAAQRAINACIDAIRGLVNGALGWALL